MKTYSLFLLIFSILLTACAPQNTATPSPTSVITNTPLATTTPEPTQTLEPTHTPIPMAEISLDSCTQIIEAKTSDTGVLEVIYASNDVPSITTSKFLFGQGTEHTGLWLWSGDTEEAVHFPLPQDALGPKLSADHHWIVFRRDIGETQSELWVIDTQGKNEKRLATVSFDEVKAHYPSITGAFDFDAILNYGWVPNTENIYYLVDLVGGVGATTHDTFVLIDVDSGQAISLAKPGEASKVVFSPDGSQAAILTESELRLVNTNDGNVQFTLPMSLSSYGVWDSRTPSYSPDGKYIIDFTDDGIVRMNTEDGQWQVIPLKYSVIVPAGGDSSPSLSPQFTWAGGSTLLLPILDSDQLQVVQPREPDPNWTFTVWQVDLPDGISHPIHTFSGFQPAAVFSPDGERLAFYKFQGVSPSQTRDLFIADLATGEILAPITGGVFEVWSPDSNQYIYSTGHPTQKGETDNSKYYLSMIGGEPILLNWSVADYGWWVDKNRLVMDCKIMRIP